MIKCEELSFSYKFVNFQLDFPVIRITFSKTLQLNKNKSLSQSMCFYRNGTAKQFLLWYNKQKVTGNTNNKATNRTWEW